MFGRNRNRNAAAESKGWWPTDSTIDRLAKAGRGTLLSVAILALYQLSMFFMQARNLEKDLRLLPSNIERWATGDTGTDVSSGPRVIETIRSLFRKTRGPSEGDESRWEEEQSCTCDMETGDGAGMDYEQGTNPEGVDERPVSNMGSTLVEEWRQRRRSRVQGGRRNPTPHHEKPVKIGPRGEIIDPNISCPE